MSVVSPQLLIPRIEATSCIQANTASSLCDALQVAQMDQQRQEKTIYIKRNKSFCSLGAVAHPKRRCIYLSALCTVDGRASKIRCGITRENVWLLFIFLPPPALPAFYSKLWWVFFCRVHSSRRTWVRVDARRDGNCCSHAKMWTCRGWPLC
jgi:hypothetical protein